MKLENAIVSIYNVFIHHFSLPLRSGVVLIFLLLISVFHFILSASHIFQETMVERSPAVTVRDSQRSGPKSSYAVLS